MGNVANSVSVREKQQEKATQIVGGGDRPVLRTLEDNIQSQKQQRVTQMWMCIYRSRSCSATWCHFEVSVKRNTKPVFNRASLLLFRVT